MTGLLGFDVASMAYHGDNLSRFKSVNFQLPEILDELMGVWGMQA